MYAITSKLPNMNTAYSSQYAAAMLRSHHTFNAS